MAASFEVREKIRKDILKAAAAGDAEQVAKLRRELNYHLGIADPPQSEE